MDHAEVNLIRRQFQANQWPQFLQMVSIDGLRGWSGQSVEFNSQLWLWLVRTEAAKVLS